MKSPDNNRSSTQRRRYLISPGALRYLVLAGILLFWELAPRLGWTPQVMLAPLSTTLLVGIQNFEVFGINLMFTVAQLFIALGIAISLGGACGLLLGGIKTLRLTILPVVASIYAVPLVILYPVLTAWIGIGPESKVIFGALYGIFPMILATAAGVQTVDANLLTACRSMGATRMQLMLQVMLPASFPSVLSGIRLCTAMAAIGVVVAEMMASTAGIGFLITQNRTMFNTAEVYFGVFLVLVLAGTLDWLVQLAEKHSTNWQPKKQVAI
ncbi:MAG: ABC transporter permease [Pusillimonas sp.]